MHMASHEHQRPLSAIPPQTARVIAFSVIIVGGALGGLLGYAIANAFCTGDCATLTGVGLLLGSVTVAIGMAIVAVLALRAMGEWHDIRDREHAGHAP